MDHSQTVYQSSAQHHSNARHHRGEEFPGAGAPAAGRTIDSPLRPGLLVSDRYRLASLLGRGGMSSVFQAQDELRDTPVAVKVFRSSAPDGDDAARQSSEVQILRALDHPNIVRAVDAGSCDTGGDRHSYLVLELVRGRTLAQLIAEAPPAPARVAEIGRQIASALAHTHDRGIVHRDIKPANILLTEDAGGDVRATLTDFGVARVLDGTEVTSFGMTVGTTNYLSPEQALGRDVTARSDIYCLGLTLLEALTGCKAFPGHGAEAALSRLLRDPSIPARLGPGWSALLTAMTSRAPQRRPSATDVEQYLAAAADDVVAESPIGVPSAGEADGDDTVEDEIFGPLACFRWQDEDEFDKRSLRSRLWPRAGRAKRRSRLQPAA